MASNIVVNLQEHFYKFRINIPNFTPELGKVGKSLDYNFTVTGKKKDWSLKIYPKGVRAENENFMSVYLIPPSDVPVQVNFQLSLVDSKGKETNMCCYDHLFQPNDPGWGWHKFISREELFDENNELMKDDVLTLSGEIKFEWKPKCALEKPLFQDFCKLQQILQDRKFADVTIKVKDKSLKAHKFLLVEASSVFYDELLLKNLNILELDDIDFEIVTNMVSFLYSNEIEGIEENVESLLEAAILYKMVRLKKYCEKYLKDHLTPYNAIATLKLAAKNKAYVLEADCLDFIGRNVKTIVQGNWRDLIIEFPELFSKIFLHCVKFMERNLSQYYKNAMKLHSNVPDFSAVCPNPGLSKITQDFENLFVDKLFTDVELKVDEDILKAHKNILSSRSAVFRAMFQHDTLEAAKNEVVITDFDFETIQELVRFIYCQKVLNLDKVALNLLPAADKYELLDLKEMCAKSLGNNLTVENVLKCLKLANMHDCPGLKKKAVAFIGRNVLTVTENSKWEKFIETNLELANEIFMEWVNALY